MLFHAVEHDKSMETVEKLLCYVFLFLGQAWKGSGEHIAFQSMVAKQGALQVRPNQGLVLANEGESYCRWVANRRARCTEVRSEKKAFPKEVKQLTEASLSDSVMTKSVNKSSPIRNLDPFMGDGLLRVGGRLRHASFDAWARNPIALPKKAHVVDLLVRHYHA